MFSHSKPELMLCSLAASLRLGGVPKSYGEHVIVVGDAAGMIDPMTGNYGIKTHIHYELGIIQCLVSYPLWKF